MMCATLEVFLMICTHIRCVFNDVRSYVKVYWSEPRRGRRERRASPAEWHKHSTQCIDETILT